MNVKSQEQKKQNKWLALCDLFFVWLDLDEI